MLDRQQERDAGLGGQVDAAADVDQAGDDAARPVLDAGRHQQLGLAQPDHDSLP